MTRETEKECGKTSPLGKTLWVYKTGLLMFKWQGLYHHSDMLPNGGVKKTEKHALSGHHSGEENSLSKP